jgi:hypothetical protein
LEARKSPAARIALGAALIVLALAIVPFALAGGGKAGGGGGGKPHGGGGSGTLALVVVSSPVNDNLPHYGGRVTYTVSTTATVYPYVSTNCYQGTTLVGATSAGFYPSYAWPDARIVPLQSQVWTGGAADCTAKLYSMDGGSQTILATLSFHVYA